MTNYAKPVPYEEVALVDWSRAIKTRSGKAARVICANRKAPAHNPRATIVVLIDNGYCEGVEIYPPSGRYSPTVTCSLDIVNYD